MNKKKKIILFTLLIIVIFLPISITLNADKTGWGAGKGGAQYSTKLTYIALGFIMIGGTEHITEIPPGDSQAFPDWKRTESINSLKPFSRPNIYLIIKKYGDDNIRLRYGNSYMHQEIFFYLYNIYPAKVYF